MARFLAAKLLLINFQAIKLPWFGLSSLSCQASGLFKVVRFQAVKIPAVKLECRASGSRASSCQASG